MNVFLSGCHAGVTRQVLHNLDACPFSEKIRAERVPQAVEVNGRIISQNEASSYPELLTDEITE
jgi:hypothetical protein